MVWKCLQGHDDEMPGKRWNFQKTHDFHLCSALKVVGKEIWKLRDIKNDVTVTLKAKTNK